MNQELINTLASKLGIEYDEAESLLKQEIARKEAGKKYRQSQAYKLRLEQQKVVRQMLKAEEV